ncbi:N-alpha-acetyltransferase 38, NatC auxiliary subunit [Chamberlinius hualienensis]
MDDNLDEFIEENEQEDLPDNVKEPTVKSSERLRLESWLNKNMRIEMSDGRLLIGIFLCTDQARNVILGSCHEYLKPTDDCAEDEPRFLGLAMVPGHHIVSIMVDEMLSSDIL